MARKTEERSTIAGKRFKKAKTIIGKSYEKLIADNRWAEHVKIYDVKTIRGWVKFGLPLNKVTAIADYFGVMGYAFTDERMTELDFEKKIHIASHHRRHPDKYNSELKGVIEPDEHFRWNELEREMLAIENQPVYGDAGCILKDIFVFQTAEIKQSGMDHWKNIGDLKAFLMGFDFKAMKPESDPIIIFGDFGIGKSSFLKMLTATMLRARHDYFPIYIPLRELPVYSSRDIVKAMALYLDRFGSIAFNRLNRDVLFLLDGFDELNLYQQDENWIRRHLERLNFFSKYQNVHVIISSRPILFLKEFENIPAGSPVLRIREFDDKQIVEWIDRWKSLPESTDSEMSLENLRHRYLLPLVRNPLLLYMTAKIYDTELDKDTVYSKGTIYRLYYDWTIKGKFKDDKPSHQLPHNYRKVLQNIAMTMRSVGSKGTLIEYSVLKKRILEFQKELPDKELFEMNELILVGHFFKVRERKELKWVEFGHQSFGEYLVAEKIFEFLKESVNTGKIDNVKWLALGRQLPSEEEFEFLRDLLFELPDRDVMWIYDQLRRFKCLLIIGTGHFRKILSKFKFADEREISGIYYRSINLSAMAFILCNIIYDILYLKWDDFKNEDYPAKTLRPLVGYIYHICHTAPASEKQGTHQYQQTWQTVKRFLAGIDLSELILEGIDFSFADLKVTDFTYASLTRCSFESTSLHAADFSHAVLDGVNFSNAACDHTAFSHTRLKQATFREAWVCGVRFIKTEFLNVDFSKTFFEDCEFIDCLIRNVIWDETEITNCKGLPKNIGDSA